MSRYAGTLTNEQLAYVMTSLENDPRSAFYPGYAQYLAGDGFGPWTHAYSMHVIQIAGQIVTLEPLALMRDVFCGYVDDTYRDHLARIRIPVLSIQSGSGIGSANNDTLEALHPDAPIMILFREDFGYMDWIASANQKRTYIQSMLYWIETTIDPGWSP